jgi:hypothetical protein
MEYAITEGERPCVKNVAEAAFVSTEGESIIVLNVVAMEYAITVKTSVIAKCVEAVDYASTADKSVIAKCVEEVEYAITGKIGNFVKCVEAVDSALMASKSIAAPNANGSKGSISVDSYHLRDSALVPKAPDLADTPTPSNQAKQPETEMNCIDQLMQDHTASCLARSIDPFPSESQEEIEIQESMYVQFPRLSNPFSESMAMEVNEDFLFRK